MPRLIGDIELDADAAIEISGSVDVIFALVVANATVSVIGRRRRRAGDGGAAPWWWAQYASRILAERAAEAERLRLQNFVDGDVFAAMWLPLLEATGLHDPDAAAADFIVAAFSFLASGNGLTLSSHQVRG